MHCLSVLAHMLIRNTCSQAAFEKIEQLKYKERKEKKPQQKMQTFLHVNCVHTLQSKGNTIKQSAS